MIFADTHLHTNPISGLGMSNIAPQFKKVNGWFLAIVSLPPSHYGLPLTYEGYMKSYRILINECTIARSFGLKVVCLAGLHPADVEKLLIKQLMKPREIISLADKLFKEIAQLCKEGILSGIGEVGRPHYTTRPEAIVLNEMILERALILARDYDLLVHLHLEQGGYITALDISNKIKKLGLKTHRVILHHADLKTAKEAQNYGLTFTVPGKYPILKEAFHMLKPTYTIESDFIDDPRRPGVSSYPWEIVENQLKLLREGLVNEDYLHKVNVDRVVEIYGVEPP